MSKLIKVLSAICLVALFASVVLSDDPETETETVANHSTDFYICQSKTLAAGVGSLSVTNYFDFAWRVGSIIIDMPAGITNTTTVTWTRSYEQQQYKGNEIVTNDFGFVETNVYNQVTNTLVTTWTNTLLASAPATNATTEIYQAGDDFADYVWLLDRSELTVTVSYTNAASHIIINGRR